VNSRRVRVIMFPSLNAPFDGFEVAFLQYLGNAALFRLFSLASGG
jgi:hypothetical protein